MTEIHRQGMGARAFWKTVRSQAGAFDLPSIITGVVVVGILAAGVLAAIFGVIPFSQDKAAQQDLDTVRTAEGVAKAQLGGFKDKNGLLTGGLISGDRASVGVGTDAAGSCYVGISKSATGKVYFNSDRTTQSALLTAGLDTGCIDAATRDAIIAGIGGLGSGPVAGGPIDTDGDGIPDSEDPTPNGEGGSTFRAANTWSERKVTNLYPDPGFKKGITGWTADNIMGYSDNAATAVGYAFGGYNGDAGQLEITATGSAGHNRATVYFPIDVATMSAFSFHISTPDGAWGSPSYWSAGVITTDKSGVPTGAGSAGPISDAGVLGANEWERIDYVNNFVAPVDTSTTNTYLIIQAGVPDGKSVTMHVDRVFVAGTPCQWNCSAPDAPSVSGYEPNFDGSYLSNANWIYSWTGAENASPSQAVAARRIASPATATVGDTVQIKGEGFAPNSSVTPTIFFGGALGWDGRDFDGGSVQTDGAGNFDTTIDIPASTQPWNWGIGVVEDEWPLTVTAMRINPAGAVGVPTPPGPWSALVEGSTEQISAPAAVTLDSDFTVVGRGYAPYTRVNLYDDTYWSDVYAYTDMNGNFTVTMNIPSAAASPGAGGITATGNSSHLDITLQ
ncbi:hypothetical protein [Arthrobacter sp. UYCo732]|uniref:hypothetical protein n=1 Tax=Arthrobacter sp. UYCo732 TaxID=3156336 RepID=UPI00339A0ECD